MTIKMPNIKNIFPKIPTFICFLSILYLLFSLVFYGYYKLYIPNKKVSGEAGIISTIKTINSNNLTLESSNGKTKKLNFNENSKMSFGPKFEQVAFNQDSLKVGDLISAKFQNKNDQIILLVDLGPAQSINNSVNGKITAINDKEITISTWEQNSKKITFKLNTQTKIIDQAQDSKSTTEINLNQLKINDDIEVQSSYDSSTKQYTAKNINLIKIGPERK